MPFQIIRNDITKVKADAIVNTANPSPVYGGGTDAAIYEAAGRRRLLAARKKIGTISYGEARVTPAFDLEAKYIIHTVGPIWEGGDHGELDILRSCYDNSLMLAQELNCESIAFPLIASGVNGFPKDKALQTAMAAIQAFLMEHDMTVILVVFDKKAFELSGNVVEHIREYVDSNYVEEARAREYAIDRVIGIPRKNDAPIVSRLRDAYATRTGRIDMADAMICPESDYEEEIPEFRAEPTRSHHLARTTAAKAAPLNAMVNIPDLIGKPDKTFQEKLFEIIDSRGLTGPQVYRNYVSKQVFSKIQSDRDYHPNKYTAIALCLSLHLSIEETQDLLGRAGWALSPSNRPDLVVKACILNGEYNVVRINCILFDYDCPCLDKIK